MGLLGEASWVQLGMKMIQSRVDSQRSYHIWMFVGAAMFDCFEKIGNLLVGAAIK